ncbi:MAG TPA: NAD-binding protein [Ramlibacter sp.]|nr:NAD-binding protein [Ramlibacter sp.]
MNKIIHSRHFRGLIAGAIVLLLVLATGTIGYHAIGSPTASWIDSFYMTFITVATIGYGEVIDLGAHPYGRLFTVGVAAVGIITASYLFSNFVALLLESDLNAALRRRRMERQIAACSGHYIVCGIGRVGSNVGDELITTRRRFVVIERERKTLDQWLERCPDTLYIHDDAADDDALRHAGVLQAAGVFAVTGDDSQNLMISLSVKLLNAKARVVARVHDIRNADKARRVGADEIVSPDFTGGMRIASAMIRPHAVNFMDQMLRTQENFRVEEVVVPPTFAATRVDELIPKSREYMLMATHEDGRWVFNPAGDHVVRPGVALVMMTSPSGREQLQARLDGA